ncbi:MULTISPECIES: hypothetical protein [unclassified Aeromicrobium]|uniref:hypothetical protein n=1 Tax=unclassified Aeromicrobium TaxID=2633570 RepID=UPI00396B2F1D
MLAALTGCSDDPAPIPTASASPTVTDATTTPPTESQIATTAASRLIGEYYATVDALNQNPARSMGELRRVATSGQLTALQRAIATMRRDRERQVGHTRVAEMTVQSVSLDNSDPEAGNVPTVVIDVCWDVSGADVVGPSGDSVIPANRPDTGWTRYLVANYDWSENPDGAWRVAGGEDLEMTPCSPAA